MEYRSLKACFYNINPWTMLKSISYSRLHSQVSICTVYLSFLIHIMYCLQQETLLKISFFHLKCCCWICCDLFAIKKKECCIMLLAKLVCLCYTQDFWKPAMLKLELCRVAIRTSFIFKEFSQQNFKFYTDFFKNEKKKKKVGSKENVPQQYPIQSSSLSPNYLNMLVFFLNFNSKLPKPVNFVPFGTMRHLILTSTSWA